MEHIKTYLCIQHFLGGAGGNLLDLVENLEQEGKSVQTFASV